MEYIIGIIMKFIDILNTLNITIFIVNLIIFIFWEKIISMLDVSKLKRKLNEDQKDKKLKTLKFINGILASTYLIALLIDKTIFQEIILSLFTILVIYIINSLLTYKIILFYWKEVETSWESYFQESPTSEIFSFVLNITSIIIWILIILNIFELNNWMQAWWVIWWVLALLWFSSNHWAPDTVSWLLLLHSKRIKQDDVIRILNLDNRIVWIKTISLTEIKMIDLNTENAIVVRTSKFRDYEIENISIWIKNNGKQKFIQYIDLKIWYWEKYENVKELCIDAFSCMKEDILNNDKLLTRALTNNNDNHNNEEKIDLDIDKNNKDNIIENYNLHVEIIDNWDHAVVYRFFYSIFNARLLIKIKNRLNRKLYKLSEERNIWLNTPLTIDILNPVK